MILHGACCWDLSVGAGQSVVHYYSSRRGSGQAAAQRIGSWRTKITDNDRRCVKPLLECAVNKNNFTKVDLLLLDSD
jgi:hypothetical protein